jgi:K+-sensing histidine kinase KdpD
MNAAPRTTTRRPSASDALVAAVVLGVGVALRWVAEPFLGDRYPFVTIFVVIAALASWQGAVLGIPAMLLGLLVSLVLFIDPSGALFPLSTGDTLGVVLYLLTGMLIVVVGEAKVRAQRRTVDAAEDARRVADRLAAAT